MLCNTGAGARPEQLALDLTEAVFAEIERTPELWRPDDGPPADAEPLLGRWWSEGNELVLAWKDDRLHLELVDGPVGRSVSWLTREADDRWRIVEGRELGELLRVTRGGDSAPVMLYVATYPLTRAAASFARDAPE